MEYITTAQAAEMLKVSRQTIYMYTRKGLITKFNNELIPYNVYYSREEIENVGRARKNVILK